MTRIARVRSGSFEVHATPSDPRSGIWHEGETLPDWVVEQYDNPRVVEFVDIDEPVL